MFNVLHESSPCFLVPFGSSRIFIIRGHMKRNSRGYTHTEIHTYIVYFYSLSFTLECKCDLDRRDFI